MIWTTENGVTRTKLSDDHIGRYARLATGWYASVMTPDSSYCFMTSVAVTCEADAKAAVIAWADKQIYQLQNAKGAGCQQVDEE